MNKNEMQEYIKKLQRHVLTLEAKVLTIREIAEDKVEATHQEVSWYPPSSEMARELRNQVTGMRRMRDAIIDELDAEDSFYAAVQVNEARLRAMHRPLEITEAPTIDDTMPKAVR